MKVHKIGQVRITNDEEVPIKVEGWNIELEDSDPQDAAAEELLLAFAARWALDSLIKAVDTASRAALKKWAAKKSQELIKHGQVN